MFRTIRILVLLYILLIVAVTSWSARERRTDWDQPLWVAVYPINGDGSAAVAAYIGALDKTAFEPIESFMHAEAKRWNVALDDPVEVKLAPVVGETPPSPPRQGNALSIGLWSLKIRYWAWRHDTFDGPKDIKIFIVYFDPERTDRLARMSLAVSRSPGRLRTLQGAKKILEQPCSGNLLCDQAVGCGVPV